MPAQDDTFAAGWNARCDNKRRNDSKSRDWLEGWNMCDSAPENERFKFNPATDGRK